MEPQSVHTRLALAELALACAQRGAQCLPTHRSRLSLDDAIAPSAHDHAQVETLMLPAEITARLTRLSRVEYVSLATVMLAAWGLLLSTYHGKPDVLVAYAAGDRLSELGHSGAQAGGLNNLQPLHLRIDGDRRLGSWLQEIQSHQLNHEAIGHLALADILHCGRVRAEPPLFHSLVVVKNTEPNPAPWSESAMLACVAGLRGIRLGGIPLTLLACPGEHLRLELIYGCTPANAATIRALLGRLGQLLARFARGGAQRLTRLSQSSQGESNDASPVADEVQTSLKPVLTGAGTKYAY
jgi:hypothetical protein